MMLPRILYLFGSTQINEMADSSEGQRNSAQSVPPKKVPETPQQKLSSDDISDLDLQVEHQILTESARITDEDLCLMNTMMQLVKPVSHSPRSTAPTNSSLDFPPLPFPAARKR
jgi:hypothetical protein